MESYIGQIILFGGNFTIKSFAPCAGQLLAIASNTALFSILGTTYGGNGQTTFGLPDLRGRAAIGTGQGPGLAPVALGEMSGSQQVTLTTQNMPAHNHLVSTTVNVSTAAANSDEPGNAFLTTTSNNFYATAGSPGNNLGGVSSVSSNTGGNQPVSIMPPYLGLNYQICLYGIFPSRN